MPVGYWCLVLHAHLPYVRHPEHPLFLEENWFFEALTDSYVPLLMALDRLEGDGVDFRLTMSLSATLVSMMRDPLLVGRYERHLESLVKLARREVERTLREAPQFRGLAGMYLRRFEEVRRVFQEAYRSDLPAGFRRHRDAGRLELLASAATHGLLPLLTPVPGTVRAQVLVGVAHYRSAWGREPKGFWLPECGYQPGIETFLREAGLRYSFLETHGLTHAHPRPTQGAFAPIVSPGGVVFLGRDPESSREVWSAEAGYPGDPEYREFYRDAGWDLPPSEVDGFLGGGPRRSLGIKYHRVTGKVDLAAKEPYRPDRAASRAAAHARDFVEKRCRQVQRAVSAGARQPPLVVSPYDAELFGHWWFEGPAFLENVFRELQGCRHLLAATTPGEFLELYPVCEEAQPVGSSWGAGGHMDFWLNPQTDWMYVHLDGAGERMAELARRFSDPDRLTRRALDQAARELLLAQASDWAFMLRKGTTVEYAGRRVRDHLARFNRLYRSLTEDGVQEAVLGDIERLDAVFPEIDYRLFG